VLLTEEGHVYLADFGIARILSTADAEALTSYGIIVGTWPYMSPEQCAGDKRVDHRSDVYSLGCLVFEMLTGETPFTGPSGQAIAAKHMGQAAPSLSVVLPDAPTSVSHAVAKALAKAPAQRFQKAGDFAAALSAVSSPLPPPANWRIRRLAALGAVAAALSLGAYVLSIQSTRLHQRDWVVVADFEGPQDDPGMGMAVRELVSAELSQSRFVSVLPRQQLLATMRLAGIRDTTRIGTETAKELAVRTSVRAVVTGNVSRLGANNYSIVAHVLDPESGRTILSAARAATDQGQLLVQAVQAVGRELRAGVGERKNDLEATLPLMQIATPSFAAFRKFAIAVDLQTKGDYIGSNVVLREALALDSQFASAWAQMGVNYLTNRNPDSATLAFQQALRFPLRLTDARRYRLLADVAYAIDHDLPAAIKWYDLYLELEPWSYAGHNNRALYLSSMGRHEEALAEFNAALATNPVPRKRLQIELLNKTAELVVLGRVPSARSVAVELEGPFAQYAALLFAAATSNWGVIDSLARGPSTDPSAPSYLRIFATTALASARAVEGRADGARKILDSMAATSPRAAARWFYQAKMLLDLASGTAIGPPPAALVSDTAVGGLVTHALWLALAGDTTGARRLVEAVYRRSQRDRNRMGAGPLVVESVISRKAGNWRAVTNQLASTALAGEHDATLLDRPSGFVSRWLVREAYANLDLVDSAKAMTQLLLTPRLMPPGHFALRGLVTPFLPSEGGKSVAAGQIAAMPSKQ
jgi:serine/threonine-protein kinase